jgi:hypothetical protein
MSGWNSTQRTDNLKTTQALRQLRLKDRCWCYSEAVMEPDPAGILVAVGPAVRGRVRGRVPAVMEPDPAGILVAVGPAVRGRVRGRVPGLEVFRRTQLAQDATQRPRVHLWLGNLVM